MNRAVVSLRAAYLFLGRTDQPNKIPRGSHRIANCSPAGKVCGGIETKPPLPLIRLTVRPVCNSARPLGFKVFLAAE